jgi:hypothetical protein
VGIPGFKFRPGMTSWKFLSFKPKSADQTEEYFDEFNKYEDIPEETMKEFKHFKDTMFSDFYSQEIRDELVKCLRVLPHD